MPRIFIFGLGYTAKRIAAALVPQGWEVIATGSDGALSFGDSGNVRLALADSSHVLSSVPGKWLGYLSSTGVYGDTGGAWIDESAHSVGFGGGQGRRTARAEADAQWLALGARVFRLPGIYGPGRSALDRVRAGKAHRIDVPDQVFSRVHVEDIASGVIAALGAPAGAYNLADDLPCHPNLVIEEACRQLGLPPPALLSLEQANLSAMARSFYGENRRVANGKAKRVLGWHPRYSTYHAGLRALSEG
jgi:nucleoside-diphosphate-sugar epimerase